MQTKDDKILIAECWQNKASAFEELVRRYQDQLFNTICRLIGNYTEANDICQEVFIKAYQNIKNFRGKSSFLTWLYQIAFNQCASYHRSLKAKRNIIESLPSSSPLLETGQKTSAPAISSGDPVNIIEEKERYDLIQQALLSLKPSLREVIILKDIEALSYQEISQALKISVGQIRIRINQAREILRQALRKTL